jgi:signal transduction histidine kinase
MGNHLHHASVLIVSDDTGFARAVVARWQAERHVPEITVLTSDVWQAGSAAAHDLVIVGPVRGGKASAIFSSINAAPGAAAVIVTEDEKNIPVLRAEYPHLVVVSMQDGWAGALILIANEALRRVEAVGRAQRAERQVMESQRQATLGRYMLEMRPSVNDALTSVLGNADLLLLEPGQATGESREQIQTIHTMALRLNEVMQRFSSLASEMRAGEKESQRETETASRGFVKRA